MKRNRFRATVVSPEDPVTDPHREAVRSEPVPRNARIPGSPAWCYTTMNLLKYSYQSINIDNSHFTRYLNDLREHRAWEKVPVDEPYGSEDAMLNGEIGKRLAEIEVELMPPNGSCECESGSDRCGSAGLGEGRDKPAYV